MADYKVLVGPLAVANPDSAQQDQITLAMQQRLAQIEAIGTGSTELIRYNQGDTISLDPAIAQTYVNQGFLQPL